MSGFPRHLRPVPRLSLFVTAAVAGVLLLAAIMVVGCGRDDAATEPETRAYRFSRFAMDTVVEYTIFAASREDAVGAMVLAHEEVERVSNLLWEENPGSAIFALNQGASIGEIPPEAADFIDRLSGYYRRSNGRFDPTVKSVLDLYGFGDERSNPPREPDLHKALTHVGFDRLLIDDRTTLGVGGVAKGYAVDRAVAILRRNGIDNALVNAGGDMYCLGFNDGEPWVVGVRHPDQSGRLIDTLRVSNAAVATSGDYHRFYMFDGIRYHHLIDPATGRPVRTARSATVIAPTTEEADAMSTGLFVASGRGDTQFLDGLVDVSGMIIMNNLEPTYLSGFQQYTAQHIQRVETAPGVDAAGER